MNWIWNSKYPIAKQNIKTEEECFSGSKNEDFNNDWYSESFE